MAEALAGIRLWIPSPTQKVSQHSNDLIHSKDQHLEKLCFSRMLEEMLNLQAPNLMMQLQQTQAPAVPFLNCELQSAVKHNGLKGKGALSKALVDRVRVNEV